MRNSITVRDIDPGDKSWLQREPRQIGTPMEEVVCRLIREKRTKTERDLKPSEASGAIREAIPASIPCR